MPIGVLIALVVLAATAVIATVAHRKGWLGELEVPEDRLSVQAQADAARSRSNAGMPF